MGILTSTASFPQAVSIQTTRAGFIPSMPPSSPSRFFRGKYLALLQQALRQRRLDCPSTLVRALLRDDWVVYAKPAFGDPVRSAATLTASPSAINA